MDDIFSGIDVMFHSSIRLSGEKTVYIDPYEIENETHDADIILVTHDHFDHLSQADIEKVKNDGTFIVLPKTAGIKWHNGNVMKVAPGDAVSIGDIKLEVVPAYTQGRIFHPKMKKWVGYIVEMNGLRYYIAGDTDNVEPLHSIKCDVALVPVGGKYTMNAEEAAELVKAIKPKAAVPTHYGTVVGTKDDGKRFLELLPDDIEGKDIIKRK